MSNQNKEDIDKKMLFSVDVKDVVNKTDLKLPIGGKLIFEQVVDLIDTDYVLIKTLEKPSLIKPDNKFLQQNNIVLGQLKRIEYKTNSNNP